MNRVLLLTALLTSTLIPLVGQEKGSVQRVTAAAVEGTTPAPPVKIALSGKPLKKYLQARTIALEYLASPKCSGFLSSHGFDPTQVSRALEAQQPRDGLASSVSFEAAGITASGQAPHSGDSMQAVFKNDRLLTMAISQPRGKDSYYNPSLLTRKVSYPYSNAVSVIHESLHN